MTLTHSIIFVSIQLCREQLNVTARSISLAYRVTAFTSAQCGFRNRCDIFRPVELCVMSRFFYQVRANDIGKKLSPLAQIRGRDDLIFRAVH